MPNKESAVPLEAEYELAEAGGHARMLWHETTYAKDRVDRIRGAIHGANKKVKEGEETESAIAMARDASRYMIEAGVSLQEAYGQLESAVPMVSRFLKLAEESNRLNESNAWAFYLGLAQEGMLIPSPPNGRWV